MSCDKFYRPGMNDLKRIRIYRNKEELDRGKYIEFDDTKGVFDGEFSQWSVEHIMSVPDIIHETNNYSFEEKIRDYTQIKQRMKELQPFVHAEKGNIKYHLHGSSPEGDWIESTDAEFDVYFKKFKEEDPLKVSLSGKYREEFKKALQMEYDELQEKLLSFK